MNIIGCALVDLRDGSIVESWDGIPARLDLPGGDVVFGAAPGWSNGVHALVARTLTDPDPEGPHRVTAESSAFDGQAVAVTREYAAMLPRYFTAYDLVSQLTPDEIMAIDAAAAADKNILWLWVNLRAPRAKPIDLQSSNVQAGLAALAQIVGAERGAAILAGIQAAAARG